MSLCPNCGEPLAFSRDRHGEDHASCASCYWNEDAPDPVCEGCGAPKVDGKVVGCECEPEADPMDDLVGLIVRFEQGSATDDEVLGLFQRLVDTDLAWKLQGTYGRTAVDLLHAGLIHPKR